MVPHRIHGCALLLAVFLLAGCSVASPAAPSPTQLPTATPEPPTATPIPLAAVVNGEGITLADYQAELARFESAQQQLGTDPATLEAYRETVLQALIDLTLLAQGAEELGVELTQEELSAKVDSLATESDGGESMGTWLAANGYDLEGFKRALRREALAAAMTARLVETVPDTVPQVHARHILVDSQQQAQSLLAELEGGADFGQLALTNSLDLSTRVDGGNLGWFPRGVLTQPAVEEAAFRLQPGERSEIIESELGFHIIEVLERDDRAPSPNARRRLERLAVETWLDTARAESDIEILIDP